MASASRKTHLICFNFTSSICSLRNRSPDSSGAVSASDAILLCFSNCCTVHFSRYPGKSSLPPPNCGSAAIPAHRSTTALHFSATARLLHFHPYFTHTCAVSILRGWANETHASRTHTPQQVQPHTQIKRTTTEGHARPVALGELAGIRLGPVIGCSREGWRPMRRLWLTHSFQKRSRYFSSIFHHIKKI